MSLSETLFTAINSLKSNKTRSFLTMLGVVIGVFAVISLTSLVGGVKNFVVEQFSSIGTNLILVAPGRFSFGKDPAIIFANNKLTAKDADYLNKYATNYIVAATPNIRLSKTVKYKDSSFLANLVGANYRFLDITNFEISNGRSFDRSEEFAGARVAVIGPQVAKKLFSSGAVGKIIKIADVSFTVIGVTKPKGLNADERVIVPYTTLKKSLGVQSISGISIKAKDGQDIDEAMQKITELLLNNHKKDEFSVLSQKDILNSFQNILRVLSLGIGAIAGISLVVGGIGIMNIMLVSVNERISEIGLRKAFGATSKSIATQFIFESAALSIVGCLLGVILGYLLTISIRSFIHAEIPPWAIFLSFGFSILIGVGFGTYPAVIASRKDPIESLRYEI